jgi:hypothetical protein
MIDDWCSKMAGIRPDKQSGALWPRCYIEGGTGLPAKTRIFALNT